VCLNVINVKKDMSLMKKNTNKNNKTITKQNIFVLKCFYFTTVINFVSTITH